MSVPAATPATPAADEFKIFAGNLSFGTTHKRLFEFFEPAGNIVSANVITRGARSLGYGFVVFSDETNAKNAVSLFNKKELDGREINVELARPRGDGPRPRRPRARRFNRGPKPAADSAAPTGNAPAAPAAAPTSSAPAAAAPAAAASAPAGQGEEFRTAGGRRGGNRGGRGGNRGGRGRGGRRFQPRPPRAPRTGEASKTTLFVANLPFSVDDALLKTVFETAGLNPVNVHVVIKRNGRSKGFAFVELTGEEDQKKGIEALNDKEVEGRRIAVKIALNENTPAADAVSPAPNA